MISLFDLTGMFLGTTSWVQLQVFTVRQITRVNLYTWKFLLIDPTNNRQSLGYWHWENAIYVTCNGTAGYDPPEPCEKETWLIMNQELVSSQGHVISIGEL